jgi:hypothetical protein
MAAIGIIGEGGLEPCMPEAGAARMFLGGLEALRDHVAAVRAAFHEGRLAAASPQAAQLPIEHHVSALSRIEELLAFWANPAAARERRSLASAGESVPLHAGLGEILARGFGPAVGDVTAIAHASPADGSGSPRAGRSESYGIVVGPIGARAVVEDLSTHGMGLSFAQREGAPGVGDLVGARLGSVLRIGRVVRSFADPASHRLRIGVRILADNPARVELVNAAGNSPRAIARVQALFAPGADPEGIEDSLIVPRAAFDAATTWELALDRDRYSIRLCRDQVCGRGWVAARFEVLEARER